MDPNTQNINIADYYFNFFKNLKHGSKLDLVTKLSGSLKNNVNKESTSLGSLLGAYRSAETAEEIIAELKASRVFNRTI